MGAKARKDGVRPDGKGMDAELRELWFNKLLGVMGKRYTREGILTQSSGLESLSLEHCKL